MDTTESQDLFSLIEFRQATIEDINFIKKTWLTSLRLDVDPMVESTTFYPEHEAIIGNIAKDTPCWIAADKEHPFYIYGWGCGVVTDSGLSLLHYIFVRPEWRRRGLALAIAKQLGWQSGKKFVASHNTHFVKARWRLNMTLNPYVLGRYQRKVHETVKG